MSHIQAYMPYESSENQSNKPHGPIALGSHDVPIDPFRPPEGPSRPLNMPLDPIGPFRITEQLKSRNVAWEIADFCTIYPGSCYFHFDTSNQLLVKQALPALF